MVKKPPAAPIATDPISTPKNVPTAVHDADAVAGSTIKLANVRKSLWWNENATQDQIHVCS